MYKFLRSKYTKFSELPLEQFNTLTFSVYVIDFNWNYLFVNNFAANLKGTRNDLAEKNMQEEFKELVADPDFMMLKTNIENHIATNVITTSPITGQRFNIVGYPLKDCYYFSSSILPNKEELIDDLRIQLKKKRV